MLDDLARLIAIEEIRKLKARYFRYLDTKDWDGLADVFTPDIVFDLREVSTVRHPESGASLSETTALGVFSGRAEVLAMIRAAVAGLLTAHHGHMSEIDIVTETTATGVWAMEDVIRSVPGAHPVRLNGYGHYHDRYEKLERGWAIGSTRITRLLLD